VIVITYVYHKTTTIINIDFELKLNVLHLKFKKELLHFTIIHNESRLFNNFLFDKTVMYSIS